MRPSVAQYSICPATERGLGDQTGRQFDGCKKEVEANMKHYFMTHFELKKSI
jgi:hypothetical protein